MIENIKQPITTIIGMLLMGLGGIALSFPETYSILRSSVAIAIGFILTFALKDDLIKVLLNGIKSIFTRKT